MTTPLRKVVLGLGNILNCDEGLGVLALKQLDTQLTFKPPELELLDGGVLGLNLLMIVEDCSHLLLMDAVDAGKSPGTVIELEKEQIPLYAGVKLSQHQVTFQEVLGLANMRGKLPPYLHLVGVQPQNLEIGLGLSDAVREALPDMIHRAERMLRRWNLID